MLGQVVGGHAQTMFGIALLASGLSSSSVGTLAGQVVMQGFIRRSIPLFVRRGITMAPAMIVLAIGVDPSKALVLSQVALSFGIPFALMPLVLFCRDRSLMGTLTNRPVTTAAAFVVATVIVCLNVFLLVQTIAGARQCGARHAPGRAGQAGLQHHAPVGRVRRASAAMRCRDALAAAGRTTVRGDSRGAAAGDAPGGDGAEGRRRSWRARAR